MTMLSTLGRPPQAPTVGLHPAITSARLRRVNVASIPRRRPSDHPDPAIQHEAAGLLTELCSGTVMVDHAARKLAGLGLFQHAAKYHLNQLVVLTDKLLVGMITDFDGEDVDATNLVSEALGLVAEKFCQLTPAQMDAALRHMDEMVKGNVAYVPAPTPITTNLKD